MISRRPRHPSPPPSTAARNLPRTTRSKKSHQREHEDEMKSLYGMATTMQTNETWIIIRTLWELNSCVWGSIVMLSSMLVVLCCSVLDYNWKNLKWIETKCFGVSSPVSSQLADALAAKKTDRDVFHTKLITMVHFHNYCVSVDYLWLVPVG